MTYQKDGIFVECTEAKYKAEYKRFGFVPVQEPTDEDKIPSVDPDPTTEPEKAKGKVKK